MPEEHEAIVAFRDALRIPRASMAYGTDTRELRHNAFLHFMLSKRLRDFQRVLLLEISRNVLAQANVRQTAEWQAIANALENNGHARIESKYNESGRSGRPDEVITIHMPDGLQLIIVVEMKVKALESENQLEGYVKERGGERATVVGLLLRIPGRDEVVSDFAKLNGSGLRACVQAAWSACSASLAGDSNYAQLEFLINDYAASLDFMDRADEAIAKAGPELKLIHDRTVDSQDEPLKEWLDENWRWFEERIMRASAEGILKEFRPRMHGVAYGTKDGAGMDFYFVQSGMPWEAGANLYLHWKLGRGLQVRIATNDYPKKPNEALYPAMVSLVSTIQEQLVATCPAPKCGSLPPGRASCEVAGWECLSYDVDQIVSEFVGRTKLLSEVLPSTIAAWGSRNGWETNPTELVVFQPT